jgi:uncharacterized phage protein gp47/JayE
MGPTKLDKTLSETTNSIKRLIDNLERREKTGESITAAEIEAIAYELDNYVEDLLSAARSLPRETPIE